jgi:hypothetical protein
MPEKTKLMMFVADVFAIYHHPTKPNAVQEPYTLVGNDMEIKVLNDGDEVNDMYLFKKEMELHENMLKYFKEIEGEQLFNIQLNIKYIAVDGLKFTPKWED